MSGTMKRCLGIVFLVAVAPIGQEKVRAANLTATSCSQTDVQVAIDASQAGDTVNVPSGNCTWTRVTLAKAITLNGTGKGATNITLGTGSGMLAITKQAAGVIRIQNLTFLVNNNKSTPKPVTIGGSWLSAQPVIFQDLAITLTNADFVTIQTAGGVIFSRLTFNGSYQSTLLQAKDAQDASGSWSTPSSLGALDSNGLRNIYVEDSTFFGGTVTDCDDGCRLVLRNNTISNSEGFNSHGMDTSAHGLRHFEIYNNAFLFPDKTCTQGNQSLSNMQQYIWIRGGTGVIYNNKFDQNASSCWGHGKNEMRWDIRGVEDARRNINGDSIACGQVRYPAPHQLGQGHSGSAIVHPDPIHVWGNSVNDNTRNDGASLRIRSGFSWGNPCGFDYSTFFRWGREAINTSIGSNSCSGSGCTVDGKGGTTKPNYTPYTFPHPLVSGVQTPTQTPSPTAPADLRIISE